MSNDFIAQGPLSPRLARITALLGITVRSERDGRHLLGEIEHLQQMFAPDRPNWLSEEERGFIRALVPFTEDLDPPEPLRFVRDGDVDLAGERDDVLINELFSWPEHYFDLERNFVFHAKDQALTILKSILMKPVVIDVLARHEHYEEVLRAAAAASEELGATLADAVQVIRMKPTDDEVGEWVGLHYQINFPDLSDERRNEYRSRYLEMHADSDADVSGEDELDASAPALDAEWAVLPDDLRTHFADFTKACGFVIGREDLVDEAVRDQVIAAHNVMLAAVPMLVTDARNTVEIRNLGWEVLPSALSAVVAPVRLACEAVARMDPPDADDDDEDARRSWKSYWDHQVQTCERIERMTAIAEVAQVPEAELVAWVQVHTLRALRTMGTNEQITMLERYVAAHAAPMAADVPDGDAPDDEEPDLSAPSAPAP